MGSFGVDGKYWRWVYLLLSCSFMVLGGNAKVSCSSCEIGRGNMCGGWAEVRWVAIWFFLFVRAQGLRVSWILGRCRCPELGFWVYALQEFGLRGWYSWLPSCTGCRLGRVRREVLVFIVSLLVWLLLVLG